jgi:type I restriction enzyme S subunit
MDAFAGAIGVSDSNGKCTGEYVVCEPQKPELDNRYYAECLRFMARQNYIYVICPAVRERAPRFRFNRFKDVVLPVPPRKEQASITDLITAKRDRFGRLIDQIEKSIALIAEYRSGIISAAVTGKIDVRKEVS